VPLATGPAGAAGTPERRGHCHAGGASLWGLLGTGEMDGERVQGTHRSRNESYSSHEVLQPCD